MPPSRVCERRSCERGQAIQHAVTATDETGAAPILVWVEPARSVSVCAWQRLQHEHFDREVWVDVVIAHEADHLAASQLLNLAADVVLHDHLPTSAQIEHGLPLAGISERLLAACESVLQNHEHAISPERGLRLRGPTTGRPGQRPNHSVRDLDGELPVLT